MVANSIREYQFYMWQWRIEIKDEVTYTKLHFLGLIRVLPARVKALIASATFLLRIFPTSYSAIFLVTLRPCHIAAHSCTVVPIGAFLDLKGLVERVLL